MEFIQLFRHSSIDLLQGMGMCILGRCLDNREVVGYHIVGD